MIPFGERRRCLIYVFVKTAGQIVRHAGVEDFSLVAQDIDLVLAGRH